MKLKCYDCKHRRRLVLDGHSECLHPKIGTADQMLSPLMLINGLSSGAVKRLNITANARGIKHGWFMWPINFDPVWLESCDGFEALKGGETNEQS